MHSSPWQVVLRLSTAPSTAWAQWGHRVPAHHRVVWGQHSPSLGLPWSWTRVWTAGNEGILQLRHGEGAAGWSHTLPLLQELPAGTSQPTQDTELPSTLSPSLTHKAAKSTTTANLTGNPILENKNFSSLLQKELYYRHLKISRLPINPNKTQRQGS